MLNIYNPNQQQENQARPLPKKANAPKADFRRYDDVGGDFDNKELVVSLWWTRHKVLLYRVLVFVLLGINVLVWGATLGKWGIYIYGIGDATSLELMVSRFSNYNNTNIHFSPAPIQSSAATLLPGGVNKYDVVAEVTNPNKNFTVTFGYRFMVGSTSTVPEEMTLLAGETNLAASLGIPEEMTTGGSVVLQMENIRWKRVDNHKIQDAVSWQNERLNFSINNSIFQNSQSADGLNVNRIAFNLKNESAYSYKQPSFLVGLYNAQTLVGVLPLQTGFFKSMEEKPIELRSFSTNLDVAEVKIFPQINVYDETVYLPPDK